MGWSYATLYYLAKKSKAKCKMGAFSVIHKEEHTH